MQNTLKTIAIAFLSSAACFSITAQPSQPTAEEYAFGWPVVSTEEADFYEILLPLEVYRAINDTNLRDLAVINAAGVVIPHSISQPEIKRPDSSTSVSLALMPLHGAVDAKPKDLMFLLERSDKRTTLTLDTATPLDNETANKKRSRKPSAYIVDVRELDLDINHLELTWPESLDAFIAHIEVSGSMALGNWQLIGAGSIASLSQNGTRVNRHGIEVDIAGFNFLRLTWRDEPEGWALSALNGVKRVQNLQLHREMLELTSLGRDEVDGGYLFITDAPVLIDQVSLILPADNTTVEARVYHKTSKKGKWQLLHRGVFYHLRAGGSGIRNEPATVALNRSRHWKVVVNRGQVGDLKTVLGWQPDLLNFVAQGAGPFRLVAGLDKQRRAQIDDQRQFSNNTITNLAQNSAHQSTAFLGTRYELAGPEQISVLENWQSWLIWLGLCAGVVFVAGMALKLVQQMQNTD